jgi:hypothetical protein
LAIDAAPIEARGFLSRRRLQGRGANVDPGWRPGVLPRAKGRVLTGLPERRKECSGRSQGGLNADWFANHPRLVPCVRQQAAILLSLHAVNPRIALVFATSKDN